MISTMVYTRMDTPVGELLLFGDGGALTAINLPGRHAATDHAVQDGAALAEPVAQLEQYFAGRRTGFDLALEPGGGDFDRQVWDELSRIGYGETATYGEVAAAIGHPTAFRAVGAANGRNPIPIVVPCHRVIGSDGKLVGFGGGLPTKRRLLQLEAGGLQQQLL